MATSPQINDTSLQKRLENELASIIRVRNRAAETVDIKLPAVLSGLLPRVFHHLDTHAKEITSSAIVDKTHLGDDVCANTIYVELRRQIISQINGIVSHVYDRVAANPEMDVTCWFETLVTEICKYETVITKQLILDLMMLGIPRVNSESCTNGKLISHVFHFVENQYNKIRVVNTADAALKSDISILCKGSWILLDIICKAAGMNVNPDWQMEFIDNGIRWNDIDTRLPVPDNIIISTLQSSGAAILDLILDLLLFCPWTREGNEDESGISANGRIRIYHRCQDINVRHQMNIRVGVMPMAQRLQEKVEWNELYLRQLKYIMFRYAVWPPSGNGLFVNRDRSTLLAILAVSENSMHGRLAAHYLNHINASAKVVRQRSCSQKQWIFEKSTCSTSLVVSLLLLILGDEASLEIRQKYSENCALWESLIGLRPDSHSGSSRPPLPHTFACRAIDYIKENYHVDSRNNSNDLSLYIDLIVAIPKTRRNGVCFGLHLMDNLYRSMKDEQDNTRLHCNLMKKISSKCLEAATLVLSSLRDYLEDGSDSLHNEELALRDPTRLPGGVPAPFIERRDLSRLLAQHRVAQKRRIFTTGACNTRQTAYKIMSDCITDTYFVEENGEVLKFDIPIVLFKCASIEEDGMMQYLLETLEKVIHAYRTAIPKVFALVGAKINQQSATILPYLLDSVSRNSNTTRLMVARWCKHLLMTLDPQAAFHICSYLQSDPDALVAAEAKIVVRSAVGQNESKSMSSLAPLYMDLTDPIDIALLTCNLQKEVEAFSADLNIPIEMAFLMWHDNNFHSNGAAVGDRFVKPDALICQDGKRRDVGIVHQNEICGICYDDVDHDGYSLCCRHTFCQDCWVNYVTCAFKDRSVLTLLCPQHDCIVRVTSDFIKSLRPELLERWQELFLASYLEKSPIYCQCPGADCPVVAYLPTTPHDVPLSCTRCSTSFCFGCRGPPHQPAKCSSFTKWNQIFGCSTYWVKKNSKPCPSCNVPIEKADGCNFMTCSRCSVNFCWLCLTTLVRHSEPHTCNRYDPVSAATDESEKHALFFTERFEAHENAEEFSRRNLKHAEEFSNRNLRHPEDGNEKVYEQLWFIDEIESKQLVEIIKVLIQARQFLKFSYVEAWSIQCDPKGKDVFTSYQASLELMTERLGQMADNIHGLCRVYNDEGDHGIRMHFRSMSFVASTVQQFQHRILELIKTI